MFFFIGVSPVSAENDLDTDAACEKRILSLIQNAGKTIDAAVYAVNRQPIVKALIDAAHRGVRIRLLVDRKQQSAYKASRLLFTLLEAGIDLRVSGGKGLMHTKIAIFDQKTVSGGSFNWTNSAVNGNDEICTFNIDDLKSAEQHQGVFDRLWQKHSADFSEKWLKRQGRCGNMPFLRT